MNGGIDPDEDRLFENGLRIGSLEHLMQGYSVEDLAKYVGTKVNSEFYGTVTISVETPRWYRRFWCWLCRKRCPSVVVIKET